MVLKATANDRRHIVLCHDEFRGPRSVLFRSGGICDPTTLIKERWVGRFSNVFQTFPSFSEVKQVFRSFATNKFSLMGNSLSANSSNMLRQLFQKWLNIRYDFRFLHA
ncbi:hypothetical protein TNCV_668121 [Trichonephila clavipes]|nr:hypothetical protein TNCV_668121 [Trichonephila clavipes]